MPDFRNRVSELKYIKAGLLDPHPGNWRDHDKEQVDAMVGVLADVGIADALKAYYSPRNNNRLTVIDGHLRQGVAPETLWPVLILDVTDDEADYILATHDPLSAMAKPNIESLDALLSSLSVKSPGVQRMLDELAAETGVMPDDVDLSATDDLESDESHFWPVIRVQVRTDTKVKFDGLMALTPGKTDADKFQSLLDRLGANE